jgi:hypothetical protein
MFDSRTWFWIVGGDESRAWSSAAGGYVSEYPTDRLTRIASEEELSDVLRRYGLPVPAPAQQDYAAAIQTHVDQVATVRGYNDGVHLASYAASTVPAWAAEAAAFTAWRDAVWAYAYAQFAAVQAEQRAQPTVAELVAELPDITWPA